MFDLKRKVAATALSLALVWAAPAAAKVTQAEVYQTVDAINAELALIHKANGSKPKSDPGAPRVTKRRARHVIQKAREVLKKVELLHDLHDIESEEVPNHPVGEIDAAHVHEYVAHVLEEVRELRPAFGIQKNAKSPALPSDKSPTQIYDYLEKINLSLDGLGVREVKPFDVYRIALTVVHELEQIREKFGIKGRIKMDRHSGKTTQDIYEKSFEILADLKHMTEVRKEFAIPGGVVLPNKRIGTVTAKDTMSAMNYLLAEIGAIKVKLGITSPMRFAMPRSGPVPTNVYDAIVLGDLLIKQIEKGS